ncbi:MAG: sulfotransferase [Rhizobiales bacterium]|nr:sulfotransferase [Hyphomicrobiales bacterium]
MSHPLCGADLKTLSAIFARGGAPDGGHLLKAAGIWGAALARAPISSLEKVLIEPLLPAVSDMPPPIFILGHWRSGTTHLYNIMAKSAAFGFVDPIATGLPWDMFGLARAFRPLLERTIPRDRYIDNIPVTADAPQEDEIALANMTPISFYHAIYFPKVFHDQLNRGLFFENCSAAEQANRTRAFTHFMQKLAHRHKKPLLIKNPVYTGCPQFVKSVFPDAKFIHIHRNPFDVFLSMRNFYSKLLPVFALQDFAHLDIDEVVLSTYSAMMHRFEQETADMAAPEFVEIGYDALSKDPLDTIKMVYEMLGLDGFDDARPAFSAYLGSVQSYQKNTFKGSPALASKVADRLSPFIEKWDYAMPEIVG